MRITVFVDGLNPVVLNATRVVVQTDDGTPVLAAVTHPNGEIQCNHVDDGPAFPKLLRDCGIERTVIVEHIRVPTIEDFKI